MKKQTLLFKEKGSPKKPLWELVGEELESIILSLPDEWVVRDIWKGKILLTSDNQVRIICEVAIPNKIVRNICDQVFTVKELEQSPLHQSLRDVGSENFAWFAKRIAAITKAV